MGRHIYKMMGLLALALVAGCGSEDGASGGASGGDDLCARASEHLAACLGQEAGPPAEQCDEAQAGQLLATDCSAFEADPGKADGLAWWCTPWTPPWVAGCGGSTPAEPEAPAGDGLSQESGICGQGEERSLNPVLARGRVDFAFDSLGSQISAVSCARVALRDPLGNLVAVAHTGVNGRFELRGAVKTGEYDLIVLDRYGEGEENIALEFTKEPAVRPIMAAGLEVPEVEFTLSSYRNGDSADFGFQSESEKTQDAVGRCAQVVFGFEVQDSCGEAVAPYGDVRRDWALTLENGQTGEVSYATPLCQPANGDHWSWDGCDGGEDDINLATFGAVLPGEYEVKLFRVDLPNRNNIDVEAELCRRLPEADAEVIQFSFEAVEEGGVLDVGALLGEAIRVTDAKAGDCR